MSGSVVVLRKQSRDGFGRKVGMLLCIFLGLLAADQVRAQFDSSNWKLVRSVKPSSEVPDGPAGIALQSGILEKCRPDLMDLRLVDSEGRSVPYIISDGLGSEEPEPFPARIFRVARKQGAWTDIWTDMSAKVLTRGVLVQTSTRDFVRRIEIRGSDNGKESYVIRVDGLIADIPNPMPIRTLTVFYPAHNFQYLHIRIIDEDKPPLKIEGVLCYPPVGEDVLSRAVDARIVENHGNHGTGTTTVVADLGERRFPATSLRISSPTKEFAKKVTVFGAPSASSDAWKTLHEGSVFRLAREDASEETLGVRFNPTVLRFIKLQLSGKGTAPVAVERLSITGTVRLMVFNHQRGREYRLYYVGPQTPRPAIDTGMTSIKMAQVAAGSDQIRLGPEQRNTPPPKPVQTPSRSTTETSPVRTVAGVLMVLVGLLLLFTLMLRARSRRHGRRPSRTFDPRI